MQKIRFFTHIPNFNKFGPKLPKFAHQGGWGGSGWFWVDRVVQFLQELYQSYSYGRCDSGKNFSALSQMVHELSQKRFLKMHIYEGKNVRIC